MVIRVRLHCVEIAAAVLRGVGSDRVSVRMMLRLQCTAVGVNGDDLLKPGACMSVSLWLV